MVMIQSSLSDFAALRAICNHINPRARCNMPPSPENSIRPSMAWDCMWPFSAERLNHRKA